MTETTMYFNDDHSEVFNDEFAEERFGEFLNEMEEKTTWLTIPMSSMKFSAVNTPLQMSSGATESEKNTVLKGTKMFAYGEKLPYVGIRDCAMNSMTERFGVGCKLFENSTPEQKAALLNMSAAMNEKRQTLVSVVDGKINAVLSANDDKNSYQIFSPVDVFEETKDAIGELEDDTKPTRFEGQWTYDSILAKWHMPIEHEVGGRKFTTVVNLFTSNTGEGSVTYSADLSVGATAVPFMTDIRIQHRKRNNGFDILESTDMLKAAVGEAVSRLPGNISGGLGNLENLVNVRIENPANCMRLISQAVGLPKKATRDVVENYEKIHGSEETTAFALYLELGKVLKGNEDKSPLAQKVMRTNFLKLIGAQWKKYDIPDEEKTSSQISFAFND